MKVNLHSVSPEASSVKRILQWTLVVWVTFCGISLLAFVVQPKGVESEISLVQQCCMILTGLSFFVLFRKENDVSHKAISLNFFLFAGLSQLLETASFLNVSRMFWSETYFELYRYQYVTCGLLPIMQFLSVVYAALILVDHRVTTGIAYLITGGALILIVLPIYYPYAQNARYLYTVRDVVEFRTIDRSIRAFEEINHRKPSVQEVAENIVLLNWGGGQEELGKQEELERVEEILPYLSGSNYLLLLMKPLHKAVFWMNILAVFILVIFFAILFFKDPPGVPYIDRILFVFLCYCVIQSFHYWVYSNIVEAEKYVGIFRISAILTIVVSLFLPPLVFTRLRFVMSAEGRYYHSKIDKAPLQISRWRDGIDNMIIKHFARKDSILRRLAASRKPNEAD